MTDEPPPKMPPLAEWQQMSAAERRVIAKQYAEWLSRGGHRTNVMSEKVKQSLAERERSDERARQYQAHRTPESRARQLSRIADEEKHGLHPGRHWDGKHWRDPDGKIVRSHAGLPEPAPGFDPTRYDPAHPHYDYDAASYNPADYDAWKQSRIAYLLKQQGHDVPPNPFGPDGSASVRGEVTPKNWIKVTYRNIVQLFRPGV
jgi:hypothetical protein